jgi:hypothetical protein
MIRDGQRWDGEIDRNGPRLYFGDERLNDPLYQYEVGSRWGWGWLRENPDIDIATSTILAPDLTPEPRPVLSVTQATLRQLQPSPHATPRRWRRMRLEIGGESFLPLFSPIGAADATPEEWSSRPASEAEIGREVVAAVAALKAAGATPSQAAVLKVVQGKLPEKDVSGNQVKAALKRNGLTLLPYRPRKPH